MRKRLAGIGAGALAVLVVAGVTVWSAAAATPGGKIAFYASAGTSATNHGVFTGAVGDYGTLVNMNKDGKVNPNGNFVKATLTKGTFELDITALNKILSQSGTPLASSTATCSNAFSGSGPVKFFNGTGPYKGISGTATVTVTFGGVGPRYTSGPKKGQCNQNAQAFPGGSFGVVMGHGTVSFAS